MKLAKKLLLIAAIIACAFVFSGCKSQVVYDNYIDSFRYKPETEYDYYKEL